MAGKPTKLGGGSPSVVKTFRFGADELERLEALTEHFTANPPANHPGRWTEGDSVREALYLVCVWLELEEEQTPNTATRPTAPSCSTPAKSTPAPLSARLYEAMGQLADDTFKLVWIPDLVRALAPTPTSKVHDLLREEQSAGRIELRPEANPQDLFVEDRPLTLPGPRGSRLSSALDIRTK